jgi:cell wall assembly regulator SMI1
MLSKTDEKPEVTLPTDETGKQVYPIFYPDKTPLATDSTGRYVKKDGEPIPQNDYGQPINARTGELLPKDEHGNYIFKDPMVSLTSFTTIIVSFLFI